MSAIYIISAIIIILVLSLIIFIYNNIEIKWIHTVKGLDTIVGKKGDNGLYNKNTYETFNSNPASLNYNMGKYSNLILPNMDKEIPLKKQSEHLYTNGTNVDGTPVSPKSMAIFQYNFCKPECCPATYSCSGGCICQTSDQKKFINRRGNNRTITDAL